MKTKLLFLLFSGLACSLPVIAEPSFSAVLLERLKTVNAHWDEKKIALVNLEKPLTCPNGTQLIQLHLQWVEEILSAVEKPELTPVQKKNRAYCLQQLHAYWQRGAFPINTFHKEPRPYFVDIFGAHCAVGYLMHKSGADELVKAIRVKQNYSYIEELVASFPKLKDWAIANGFTVEELAWIQPSYLSPSQDMFPIGNGGGANGPVHTMEVSPDGSTLYLAGDFTEIDGVQANSIVAWNGSQWSTLGAGVEGAIYALHFHHGKLHIAGNFKLSGQTEYSSIAYWDNDHWVALQQGYTGNIYTMETYQGRLYIGGGFQFLNHVAMPFLAFYDEPSGSWSNSGYALENDILVTVPGMFSVNDTVRSLKTYHDYLFVGGDFTYTSPNVNHPNVVHYQADHYARWYGYLWLAGLPTNLQSVNLMTTIGDSLYLIGPMDLDYDFMKIYHNGTIETTLLNCWVFEDQKPPLIYGHLRHGAIDYFYGNIRTTYGFYYYTGFLLGYFNAQVRAASVFQGNIYFAGDFTKVFGEPFNGLAYSPWGSISSNATVSPQQGENLRFYVANKQLRIKYPDGVPLSKIKIFNIAGQLLHSSDIGKNETESTVNLEALPNGLYVFQWMNRDYQKAEVFALY